MILTGLLVAAAQPSPVLLSAVSSPLNDYNPSSDAREQLMVFARSEAEFQNAKIHVAKRQSESWTAPRPISFSDERYSDSDPWLTPDGQAIYFISNRPAPSREPGRTDYDIWRSFRTATGWSAPVHLGPEVNSRGQELGPELHRDTLYFSSTRPGGLGGLDIYEAKASGSGFKTAAPIRGPFNTKASESDFTLRHDGRAAMFWRSEGQRGIIHISYRGAGGWSAPVPLSEQINAGPFNFTPNFNSNGSRIRYASTLERSGQPNGMADIYEAPLPRP